jgi:hypothetical protein
MFLTPGLVHLSDKIFDQTVLLHLSALEFVGEKHALQGIMQWGGTMTRFCVRALSQI